MLRAYSDGSRLHVAGRRAGCARGVGVDVRHSLLAQIDCREPRLREARAAQTAYGAAGPYGHRRPAPQVRGGMTNATKTRPSMRQSRRKLSRTLVSLEDSGADGVKLAAGTAPSKQFQ